MSTPFKIRDKSLFPVFMTLSGPNYPKVCRICTTAMTAMILPNYVTCLFFHLIQKDGEQSRVDDNNDIIAENPKSNEKDLLIDEPLEEKQDAELEKNDKPFSNGEIASATKAEPDENLSSKNDEEDAKPSENQLKQTPETQTQDNKLLDTNDQASVKPIHENSDPEPPKTPKTEAKPTNGENSKEISEITETNQKPKPKELSNKVPEGDNKIQMSQNLHSDTTV